MKFYSSPSRGLLPRDAQYPCFVLEKDSWDDFSFRTLFSLKFYDANKTERLIGDVKILNINGDYVTQLPSEFDGLDDSFCSLGQTTTYYSYFQRLSSRKARSILWGLKDITLNSERYEKFKNLKGFDLSLIRFSEALSAFHFGVRLFNPHYSRDKLYERKPNLLESTSFVFQAWLENADTPHEIEFKFDNDPWVPRRINVLIGKNGTGKTAFLVKLANCLSGWKPFDGEFPLFNRPKFTKIFAVSYSPFEDFSKPNNQDDDKRTFSYKYCGIRDENDHINVNDLIDKSQENIIEILNNDYRRELFLEFLQLFSIDFKIFSKSVRDFIYYLSSGQRVLLFILSDIVANVSEKSLIIFDEPENHLHPNILSQLMIALRKILEKYNSYAIIATHSPIVLQDVPSDCVKILKRTLNTTHTSTLTIESFAENLTTLTEEVFETSLSNSNWANVLYKMAQELPYEEALSLFKNPLSLNGQVYLKSLYLKEYKK